MYVCGCVRAGGCGCVCECVGRVCGCVCMCVWVGGWVGVCVKACNGLIYVTRISKTCLYANY